MKKWVSHTAVLFFLVIVGRLAGAEQCFWSFSPESLSVSQESYHIRYSQLPSLTINKDFSLPTKTLYIESDYPITISDFYVEPGDQVIVGKILPQHAAFDNSTTDAGDIDRAPPLREESKIFSPVYDIQYLQTEVGCYYAVSLFPVMLNDNNDIIFNKTIRLKSDAATGELLEPPQVIQKIVTASAGEESSKSNKAVFAHGLPLGYKYVIVTPESLVEAFRELSYFRTATGISTAIALLDSIYSYYPGVDEAEKVRHYLMDFYQAGGTYVLLGGDDVILPPRYVYYYNADEPPSNSHYLMPSDLYYADMDGDWEVDGDGVWGEPTHDSPDIAPELVVGRLPVRTAESVQNYISKLKKYLTDPGEGDFSYLTKSMFFSSDQMRDYPADGQHGVISSQLPSYIEVDTVFGVEALSGDDPFPINAEGVTCISRISQGFGVVNIIAHGRIDGFIVKSSNYGDWPLSLILTAPQANNHGSIGDIEKNNKTSLYYSLACNNGGYDLDTAGGEPGDWSLVERLISSEASGAVGMVAYSRWGWVYSSYLQQESFTKHLYDQADGNPALAMYYSWVDYPYYRDLIYGQNYFGDPALKTYLTEPEELDIYISTQDDSYQVSITDPSGPAANASVVFTLGGVVIECGLTDESGTYTLAAELDADSAYTITAVKDSHTIAQELFVPSLVLDLDDEESMTASDFSLEQNYPNPFNPTTTIGYNLPEESDVTLSVFNILGQAVKTIRRANQSAGYNVIIWAGTDDRFRDAPSGIYFYRLKAGRYQQIRKMVLLR